MDRVSYLFQEILSLFATNGSVEPNLLTQLRLQRADTCFSGFGTSALEGHDRPAHSAGHSSSIWGEQSRGQRRRQGCREWICSVEKQLPKINQSKK